MITFFENMDRKRVKLLHFVKIYVRQFWIWCHRSRISLRLRLRLHQNDAAPYSYDFDFGSATMASSVVVRCRRVPLAAFIGVYLILFPVSWAMVF
jgi:hypothetical protein